MKGKDRHGWGIEIPLRDELYRQNFYSMYWEDGNRCWDKEEFVGDEIRETYQKGALNTQLFDIVKNWHLDKLEKNENVFDKATVIKYLTHRHCLDKDLKKPKQKGFFGDTMKEDGFSGLTKTFTSGFSSFTSPKKTPKNQKKEEVKPDIMSNIQSLAEEKEKN